MGKIFVRERRNIGKGAGIPRFEIIAVTGVDLKVYHSHIRKGEVEHIAADLGAEIVYLPRGEGEGGGEGQRDGGKRRRKGGGRQREKE
jgi:hypothetical protein